MDSWEKFEETTLPPKKDFYDKLNSTDISDYDYEHGKKFWDLFEIKNRGEYHDPLKKNAGILKRYSRGIPLAFQR